MKFLYTQKEAIDKTLLKLSYEYKKLKLFCDLGCGRGEKALLFLEYNRKITGIDRQNYRAQEYEKIIFIEKNILSSGLSDNSFDIILSYDVIEHIEEPEKLLKEMHRLLTKDGILILSTPNKYRLLALPLLILGLRKFPYCLEPVNHKNDYPDYWHIREYSSKELINLVTTNNFQVIEHQKIFYGPTGGLGLRTFLKLPLFHNHILILKKA